ncbi:MAG TPA: HAD hydrolase family protein [Spirochaetota bacterium]|nr:HAD hydrolase family protein [Spirochaetota bacterium]
MSKSAFHIVFTDLDGTLLDHNDYGYERSLPGIRLLKEIGVPLILVSSKTAAEIEILHHELGLDWPFVCENGGGIVFPGKPGGPSRLEAHGMRVNDLAARVHLLAGATGKSVRLFSDMSIDEIAERTKLGLDAAALARERSFTIPFVTTDGSAVDLHAANLLLAKDGLGITRGGRFYHFGAAGVDKGRAVRRIRETFRSTAGEADIVTTGIGDSENDLPMLHAVNRPVLVRKPDGGVVGTEIDAMITGGTGPEGFTEAVMLLFA